jgi:hypothetical protein
MVQAGVPASSIIAWPATFLPGISQPLCSNVDPQPTAGAFGARYGAFGTKNSTSLERTAYIPGTLVAHSWRIPVYFADLGF